MVYGASLSPCKISNLKIEIFPVCQETCSTALHRLVWPSRVLDGGEGMSYGLTRVYRTCSSCAIERMNQLRSMVKGATFMKRLMVFVLMILLMLLSALVGANAGTLTTFDVPGAIDTEPFGINPAGAITGFYTDASFITHGFLWMP